jgi:hypothetical protein
MDDFDDSFVAVKARFVFCREPNNSFLNSIKGVVGALADIFACDELGAALADYYVAWISCLAGEKLYSQAF